MKLNICTDKYTAEELVDSVRGGLWSDDFEVTHVESLGPKIHVLEVKHKHGNEVVFSVENLRELASHLLIYEWDLRVVG